jgi:hypothetical protein
MKKENQYQYHNNNDINNNIIRKTANFIYNKFNLKNSNFIHYNFIHDLFIFFIAFIIIFNTNLIYLAIILFIISLDAFSIVVLHQCPLTILEKKYLKKTSCEERKKILKNLGISYKCNHFYENQIELLINVWLLVACKCLVIILFKTFNIKLIDSMKLYI